jgi:putative addiction module component (TIGR02574 family)
MSATIKALGLERLSLAERIQLAGELWDSVTAAPGITLLNDAHRADLQRRLEEYRDNPPAGSSWEEVKARLLGEGS